MTYDEGVARRVRDVLADAAEVEEKRMFGGLAFMVRGNMCCGVVRGELMVRVGPEAYDAALARPHVRAMDFTGRPLRGMVFVGAAGLVDDDELEGWVRQGVSFAETLPPK